MMIELIVNGKTVKVWQHDYKLGPYPLTEQIMARKKLELDNLVLHARVESASLTHKDPHEMYVTVRSAARPDLVTPEQMADFTFKLSMKRLKK